MPAVRGTRSSRDIAVQIADRLAEDHEWDYELMDLVEDYERAKAREMVGPAPTPKRRSNPRVMAAKKWVGRTK